MIDEQDKTLHFERLYIEQTRFKHTKEGGTFTAHVDVVTVMWFCAGTILLFCKTTQTQVALLSEDPIKTEALEPLETVVHHGFVQSHAIRLAVSAHDRMLGIVQGKLPKDAERTR